MVVSTINKNHFPIMPQQEIIVRPFQEDDETAVVRLWKNTFTNDPPWNEPHDIIKRKLAMQPELFLVGEKGGQIIATVLGGYDGFRGWIYHLSVASSKRRRGIGQIMMEEIEKKLRKMGCPKINLQVRSSNKEVIEFYKSIGYRIEDHVSMGKLLV